MLKFSIVIPIYNEEDSIRNLYFSLKEAMETIGGPYEIIFVNDGSKDNSQDMLDNIEAKPSGLIIVSLNKRSGQSSAMQAGFDIARGEFIITMDGDLQNDPKDIPKLIDAINEGYDIVCGWRKNRKDPYAKLFASRIARAIRRAIFNERVHDPGCTLRILKRDILQNVYLFKGAHRFFTLIMLKLGYKLGEIEVEHHPRRFGRSKYNISNRLFEGIVTTLLFSLFDIKSLMKNKPLYEIKDIDRCENYKNYVI